MRRHLSKKRNHDEMLDRNLLDDLMNRTFSDTDDLDETWVICGDMVSTNSSSNAHSLSEEYQSPIRASVLDCQSLQDTLPMASASESEHHEPNMSSKTNEITFESTVGDTDKSSFAMTEDDSTSSLNEENRTKIERNGKLSIGSKEELSGSSFKSSTKGSGKNVSKESVNRMHPIDAMISTLVEFETKGKPNLKTVGKNHQGNKKQRNYSFTASQENVNRQKLVKESRSQESIDQL